MAREMEMRQMATEAQQRISMAQQREKMKLLLRSVANEKHEVPVADALLAAQLAKVPLSEAQQQFLFNTPYANKYASTWEANSPRSAYGLECAPRSVKWRAFNDALKAGQLQTAKATEKALADYEAAEQAAIAKAKADELAAIEAAKRRAAVDGKPVDNRPRISDDELRMVHKTLKQRLSTQFADIRSAFRMFDKDKSGHISPDECVDALMSLNVGVPKKFIEHMVNIADADRDGEINYHEFTRILSCDDITKIKVAGAEDEGLVVKQNEGWWDEAKKITREEMRQCQSMMAERLAAKGGILATFRSIDEDKSGKLSRFEVRMVVQHLNLESIVRPAVLEAIVDMMDGDGDGDIKYNEFARVILAKDIFALEALEEVVVKKEKKLTKREKALLAKKAMGLK